MNLEDLHEASFRGAFFFMDSASLDGGLKFVKHVFLDSDKQIIDDTGVIPRAFTLNGVVAARRNNEGAIIQTYKDVRDTLLRALEIRDDVGILVHPFYGRLENIKSTTFSLNERMSSLGEASISINFERSDTDGLPEPSVNVLSKISTLNEQVADANEQEITDNYDVEPDKTGNFTDATDKLDNVFTSITDATKPISKAANKINSFNQKLASFQSKITSLVSAPVDLADSIRGLIDGVGAIALTVSGTSTAFSNLFDFGDDDTELVERTPTISARKLNRQLINQNIQSSALSQSYLAVAQIDFNTINEIEDEAARLEVQYQKLITNSDLSNDVSDALVEIRTITNGFFQEQKVTAREIIEIETNPISTRSLAYQYYGSSELGEDIAKLNGMFDLAYRQGRIEIFTE